MTSSNLRITIVALNYSPEPSGTAPYTSRLAELLVGEGHDVAVVAGYPHYPNWKLADGYSGWSREEVINGVRVRRLRHYIPRQVTHLRRLHLEASFGVRVLFSRWHGPDVVLIVSPPLFSAAFAILRARLDRKNPPTGIWVQDIYSRGLEETGGGGARISALMKKVEGYVLRSASKVTVIHDRFGEYVSDVLGVPEPDISTIRNWSHIESLVSRDRSASRQALGWAHDDIVVLHAGNMGVKQGLENVVESARLADATGSKARFILLGNGNRRGTIENLARGVKSIDFMPSMSNREFQAALECADILLVNELAGLREMSVPSKLTSYFATGLPVIAATDPESTTAGEIHLSGGGLRIDAADPKALLSAVEDLASDAALSKRLGSAGRAYAEKNLSQQAAILQFGAWLRNLVAFNVKK